MKKILSVAIAAVMIGAMAIPAVSAAPSATNAAQFPSGTGTINLLKLETKYDANGNIIEQDDTTKKIDGATFTATRVLTYTDGEYSISNDTVFSNISVDDVIAASSSDSYTSYGTTTALDNQIALMRQDIAAASAANLAGLQTDSTAANASDYNYTISNLPFGVYLVEETAIPETSGDKAPMIVSTQAFLVSLPYMDDDGNWQTTINAKPKNTTIDIDKSINGSNSTNNSSDAYAIGDIIPYTVTVQVPNYGDSQSYKSENLSVTEAILKYAENGVERYNALNITFTDNLTQGLTIIPDSIKIFVGDTSVASNELTGAINDNTKTLFEGTRGGTAQAPTIGKTSRATDVDYVATAIPYDASENELDIEVSWASLEDLQGQTLTLTYSAQLNDNAVVGSSNNNSISIEFVNDPNDWTGDADDPDTSTDTDTDNDVYTYEMDLTKHFDGATNAGLGADVIFNIKNGADQVYFTKTATAGEYKVWTGQILDSNGKSYAIPETIDPADVTAAAISAGTYPEVVADISPADGGALKVTGLKDGVYTLEETKTESGYSVLTDKVYIKVEEVKNNNVVTAAVVAYTVNDTTNLTKVADLATGATGSGADGKFAITVNNSKSKFFSLPTTGGLGLWLFTVGGGIIMAGAIIFITVLRKKRG